MKTQDKIILIFILALSIGGFLLLKNQFRNAFPEVEVPIKLQKTDAAQVMDSVITSLGYSPIEYKKFITMDEIGKFYIDRVYCGDSIISFHQKRGIPVWRWLGRYFIPGREQEFFVGITPDDSSIVYIKHVLPETSSGAFIESDSAFKLAENFIVKLGIERKKYIIKNSSSENLPNRRDHIFEFDRMGDQLKDASLRIRIKICGDQIGYFEKYLHTKESFRRELESIRSTNRLFQSFATFLVIMLLITMMFVFFRSFRVTNTPWRTAAFLGIIVVIVSFINELNLMPLNIMNYDTATNFSTFITEKILIAFLLSISAGALIIPAFIAGERLYREFAPRMTFLPDILSPAGWKTKEFRKAVLFGYLFALFHLVFLVLFYTLGQRMDFWVPTDSSYTELMSTFIPWIFPFSIALGAALSEEFIFRLFGISFISRLFKSKISGIILLAIVWGFLHSNYPQSPGYVRGIEVGFIGIAAGFIFLKFGAISTLTWHFVVNSALSGYIIFGQGNAFTSIMVVIIVLIPAIMVLLGRILLVRSRIALNESKISKKVTISQILLTPKTRFTPSSKTASAVFILISVAAIILVFLHPGQKYHKFTLKPSQIANSAHEFLSLSDAEFSDFKLTKHIITLPNTSELKYVYQKTGWSGIDRTFGPQGFSPFYVWEIRLFQPEQENEYSLLYNPEGNIISYIHFVSDDDSGAYLPSDSAYDIALNYLSQYDLGQVSRWDVVIKSSEDKTSRRDHEYVWQSWDSVGAARWRVGVNLIGDEPTGPFTELKIPEQWLRQDRKNTTLSIIFNFLPLLGWAFLLFTVVLQFVRAISMRKQFFSLIFGAGVIAFLLSISIDLNTIQSYLISYDTAESYRNFIAQMWTQIGVKALTAGIASSVAVAAFTNTRFRYCIKINIPTGFKLLYPIISSLSIIALLRFLKWTEYIFNPPLVSFELLYPELMATYFPAGEVLNYWLWGILVFLPAAFAVYDFIVDKFGKYFPLLIFLLVILISSSEMQTLPEYFWSLLKNLIIVGFAWALIKTILRDHILIYIGTILLMGSFMTCGKIFQLSGCQFYNTQAIIALGLGIIAVLFLCRFHKKTFTS